MIDDTRFKIGRIKLRLTAPSKTSYGSTSSANTPYEPFGTACEQFYDLDIALPCFCLPEGFLGNALAIASAAADSPFIKASDEAERSLLYHKASGGSDDDSAGSSSLTADSSLWADVSRRKSFASPRSLPTKSANNATRKSASRSPLGPSSMSSFQPLFR